MNKVYGAFAYKMIERLSVKGIGLIISIILARLLAPEDFGQIALLTVFINISQIVIQSGFNTALVQTKEIKKSDYSTVFYISVAIAALFVIIIFLCAPIIASYYNMPSLTLPLRIYAFVLFFGAFNSVQFAKLQREMQFKQMMVCTLIATIISGVIGVSMAYLGFGLWSLVVYNMSTVIVTCIAMLFVVRWFPQLTFSVKRAKVLFQYGWKMLISAVLCTLYVEARSLIIGKKFNSDALGQYNRGQQFPNILSNTIDSAIQSVMFPQLSRAQEDLQRLKELLRKSVTLGAYLIFPTMVGLACIAEPLICVLMTEKWLPAVEYMQFICIAEANIALTSSNLVAIKSTGRSDIYMKLEILRRVSMIIILLVSVFAFNTVKAIAIGYVISSWVDVIIVLLPMKKILNYGLLEQISDLWKTVVASLVMGIAVYAMSGLNIPMICLLFVQILIGIVSYVGISALLQVECFVFLKDIAKRLLQKEKGV